MRRGLICSIDNCASPVVARGWCNMHYQRWRNHGDPLMLVTRGWGSARTYFEAQMSAEPTDACIIWPYSRRTTGYGQIGINGKVRGTHAVACERAHGPKPDGMEVAHSCGEPLCFNPRHLRWATHGENIADQIKHGTRVVGEAHHQARLTEAAVRTIRLAHSDGVSMTELGRRYGVSHASISNIIHRSTWRHVA